jgi:hypothetical protein
MSTMGAAPSVLRLLMPPSRRPNNSRPAQDNSPAVLGSEPAFKSGPSRTRTSDQAITGSKAGNPCVSRKTLLNDTLVPVRLQGYH